MAKLTTTLKAAKVNGPAYKGKKNNKDGRDLKGPKKTVAGQFWGRDRPFQCFKCHGWGHLARDCPSPENYWWGRSTLKNLLPWEQTVRTKGESYKDDESTTPTAGPKVKLEQNPVDVWATGEGSENQYYNPDPLARLIGRSNESTIVLDGEQYTALIDSGVQVTTITLELVRKLGLPIYGLKTLLNF